MSRLWKVLPLADWVVHGKQRQHVGDAIQSEGVQDVGQVRQRQIGGRGAAVDAADVQVGVAVGGGVVDAGVVDGHADHRVEEDDVVVPS